MTSLWNYSTLCQRFNPANREALRFVSQGFGAFDVGDLGVVLVDDILASVLESLLAVRQVRGLVEPPQGLPFLGSRIRFAGLLHPG